MLFIDIWEFLHQFLTRMKKWFFVSSCFCCFCCFRRRRREKKTISIEVSWKLSAAQFFKRVFSQQQQQRQRRRQQQQQQWRRQQQQQRHHQQEQQQQKTWQVKNSNFNLKRPLEKPTMKNQAVFGTRMVYAAYFCVFLRIFAYFCVF